MFLFEEDIHQKPIISKKSENSKSELISKSSSQKTIDSTKLSEANSFSRKSRFRSSINSQDSLNDKSTLSKSSSNPIKIKPISQDMSVSKLKTSDLQKKDNRYVDENFNNKQISTSKNYIKTTESSAINNFNRKNFNVPIIDLESKSPNSISRKSIFQKFTKTIDEIKNINTSLNMTLTK